MKLETNQAFVLLGSNISPIENLQNALARLKKMCLLVRISTAWENYAFGSPGPNFVNLVALIETQYSITELKEQILIPIEKKLGRVRSNDKNAPRIIDLDIIVYDHQVIDTNLWTRLYIALPLSELLPDLVHPLNGKTLRQVADDLRNENWAEIRPEIKV